MENNQQKAFTDFQYHLPLAFWAGILGFLVAGVVYCLIGYSHSPRENFYLSLCVGVTISGVVFTVLNLWTLAMVLKNARVYAAQKQLWLMVKKILIAISMGSYGVFSTFCAVSHFIGFS